MPEEDWGKDRIGPSSDREFLRQDATIQLNTAHPDDTKIEESHGSLRKDLASNPPLNQLKQDVDQDASPLDWPWNHKNKTDNSCSVHQNCTTCTESSMACHWCSFDDQCHAKGSWHGCAIGATCPSNDTVDNSCHSHKTCTECALSSRLCHWCAFDDQCHAIGSVHGCMNGVNCYSNDRCRRLEPDPITEGYFDNIGVIPLILMFSAAFMSLCCVLVLFTGAGALNGAYENLTLHNANGDLSLMGNGSAGPPIEAFSHHDYSQDDSLLHLSPIHDETIDYADFDDEAEDIDEGIVGDVQGISDEGDGGTNNSKPVYKKRKRNQDEYTDPDPEDQGQDQDSGHEGSTLALTNLKSQSREIISNQMEDSQSQLRESLIPAPVTAHPHPSRLPPTRPVQVPGNYHMNCLMRSCKAWLFFSVVAIVGFTAASVIYFPKAPEYNVCSDEFAWRSIIEGLTSLKMEASFEILMSVKNENRVEVALEGFGGKFKHDGQDIGTFSLPRTIVAATSITDLLVTCTVVPDRWEALGIISDYWKGKLAVLVDVTGSVKVKGIGFTFPIKVTDVLVKVNDPDMDDRHLCACPEWKDLVPTASPRLSFEEAVMEPVDVKLDASPMSLPMPSLSLSKEGEIEIS